MLLHVELENVSGAALRLDELGLELSSKFIRNHGRLGPGSNVNHVLRPCVSPAAAAAIKEAAKLQSHPLSAGAAAASAPAICLASGEKYTHLFAFTPVVPGKTRYTPLHIRWNRIQPSMSHPLPPPVAMVVRALKKGGDDDDEDGAPHASSSASTPLLLSSSSSSSAAAVAAAAAVVPPPVLSFPTPCVSFRKDVLYFHILKSPLGVSLAFPPSSTFGQAFEYSLSIRNQTEQMHDVELQVLEAEGSGAGAQGGPAGASQTASQTGHASLVKCVLSGKTRGLVRVRPLSTATVVYKVFPLECGSIALPRIQLKAAGLTTLTNINLAAPGVPPSAAAAAAAHSNQSILLMDPSDVGMVFVHPKPKHVTAEMQLQAH